MAESNQSPDKKPSRWREVGRLTQFAFILPAGTVAGWLLGTAIDHWLQTNWCSIAGLILGTVAGFAELIRTVISSSSE
jgi:F0F1-type ATP synthase assembly protein I